MIILSKEQVLMMHRQLISVTGGSDGIRDEGMLDSALLNLFQSFGGEELYPSIQAKAAQLCFGLVKNHAMIDGNKRLGAHVMLVFLMLNGYELIYIQEELVDIILELAAGKNKSLTMCQDVIPNTAEGKKMMYAITWNEDGTKMIQVGIEPKRLLNEIKQNNISNVVAGMPVYKGMEIIVADGDRQIIEGATDSSKLEKKLEDVGISANHDSDDGATVTQIRMDGKHCRCMMRQNDNYIVFVTVEDSFYQQGGMIAIFIVGAYLVLASCCITYMFSKVMKERLEKEN